MNLRRTVIAALLAGIIATAGLAQEQPPAALDVLSKALEKLNAQKNYRVSLTVEDKEQGSTGSNALTASGAFHNPDISYFMVNETKTEYYRKGDMIVCLHESKDRWEYVNDNDKKELAIVESVKKALEGIKATDATATLTEKDGVKTITLKPTGKAVEEYIPNSDINWENSTVTIDVTIAVDGLIKEIKAECVYEIKKYTTKINSWDDFGEGGDPETPEISTQKRECAISISVADYNLLPALNIPDEPAKMLGIK